MAFNALMIGWLGPLDGHFSWYANPAFLLALVFVNRPLRSSFFGFIGLALAVSFIFHKKIAVSEAPTYATIVAYGWGYGLWVTSMASLAVGQLLRARGVEDSQISIASLVICCTVLVGYLTYYMIGDSSLFSIHREREREFESRCATAGEFFAKRTNDAKGIFFDPDWSADIGYDKNKPEFKYITGGSVLGLGLVNSGYLLFYETRDAKTPNSYIKYVLRDWKGTKSDQLDSEYTVITKSYPIPPRLNIYGATVTIKDLRDDSLVATSTFFLERENGRFCGNSRGQFSARLFIPEALGLTRQYSSATK